MTDLATDETTGDLKLPLRLVSGKAGVQQALRLRLGFFRGEWFLDTAAGLPYFQTVFREKLVRGTKTVDAAFKAEILATPGVLSLLRFTSTVSPGRTYAVDFAVNTDFGTLEDKWPG